VIVAFIIPMLLGVNSLLYGGARMLWPGWEPNIADWMWFVCGLDMALGVLAAEVCYWLDKFHKAFTNIRIHMNTNQQWPKPFEVRLELDSVIEARLREFLAR
jgi:hypothetical protein